MQTLVLEYRLDAMIYVLASVGAVLIGRLLVRRAGGRFGAGALGWLAVLALVLAGPFVAEHAGDRERARLREMLEGIAPTYAQEMELLGHGGITVDTSPQDPVYLQLIEAQKRWLHVNREVNDIYTFGRLDDGRIVLLVDSETDYDRNSIIEGEREQRTEIGEEYEADDAILAAFEGRATFDGIPYTDRWGTWVSAHVPMFGADQRVEAVLGVDYAASKWIGAIVGARWSRLVLTSVLVLVLVSASTIIGLTRAEISRRATLQQALEEKALALDDSRRQQEGKNQILKGYLEEIVASKERLEVRERELEQQHRELISLYEAMVRQKQELEIARSEAESASRAKSEFLANMSHEIRTPMTAILGYADLLSDPRLTAEDRAGCVRTIQASGGHLIAIINDILDISKIEAGRMTVERIECAPLTILQEVGDLMLGRAQHKGLAFLLEQEGPVPATIRSDPTRLRQILVNLVGNAIKFTARGTVGVRVRLDEDRVDGPRLCFDVSDTGIGLSDEQVGRLFQPFSQADSSTTRRFGGTGLGLTICKRMAVLLGGDIDVHSEFARGSTFTASVETGSLSGVKMIEAAALSLRPVLLASTTGQSEPADRSQEPATPLAGLRVLLAEDGPDNQRLITHHLKRAGADVTVVENGELAVEAALRALGEDAPFDAILMDMQMPVMGGYDAVRALRSAGYDLPIIALTAHAMDGDRDRCVDAGCDDYATKPIDRVVLIETVRRHGHDSRSLRSIAARRPAASG